MGGYGRGWLGAALLGGAILAPMAAGAVASFYVESNTGIWIEDLENDIQQGSGLVSATIDVPTTPTLLSNIGATSASANDLGSGIEADFMPPGFVTPVDVQGIIGQVNTNFSGSASGAGSELISGLGGLILTVTFDNSLGAVDLVLPMRVFSVAEVTLGTDFAGEYTQGGTVTWLMERRGAPGDVAGLDPVPVIDPATDSVFQKLVEKTSTGSVVNQNGVFSLGNLVVAPGEVVMWDLNFHYFGAARSLAAPGAGDGGPSEVPLPAALPLLGVAVAGLGFAARRRRG